MAEYGLTVKFESGKSIAEGILKFQSMKTEQLENIGEKDCNYIKKYYSFEYLSNEY